MLGCLHTRAPRVCRIYMPLDMGDKMGKVLGLDTTQVAEMGIIAVLYIVMFFFGPFFVALFPPIGLLLPFLPVAVPIAVSGAIIVINGLVVWARKKFAELLEGAWSAVEALLRPFRAIWRLARGSNKDSSQK